MKIELDIDSDTFDHFMLQRLKEWYEHCDFPYPLEEDRLYYQNLKQHLRAVINYMSDPAEQIDDQ